MAAAVVLDDPGSAGRNRIAASKKFHTSDRLDAEAVNIAVVTVSVALTEAMARQAPQQRLSGGKNANAPSVWKDALAKAAVEVLQVSLSDELTKLIDAYRQMLRESLAKGDDRELRKALNRARLQELILSRTEMADQGQACALLGLSNANPSATMKRKEDRGGLLRFTVDGRASYPLFQFDVEGRRIYPAVARTLALRPANWSDFRLLNWFTTPHFDFDDTPAAALADAEAPVLAAFARAIEPQVHG